LLDQGEIAYERRGRRLPVDASVAEYQQRNRVRSSPKKNRPVKGLAYVCKHFTINSGGQD
jgi:hypothetical protein